MDILMSILCLPYIQIRAVRGLVDLNSLIRSQTSEAVSQLPFSLAVDIATLYPITGIIVILTE